MSGYVARRVLAMLLTVLAAVTLLFLLLHASSASPVNGLPPQVAADPGARDAFLADRGLDGSLLSQYGRYLGRLARGDLGESAYDGSSVWEAISVSAPVTLELGFMATIVAVVPGVAVGIAAARRHGRWPDGAARVGTLLAISIPSYWLAVLCLVLVGERAPDLLPSAGGFRTFSEDPVGNIRSLLLPALVLGLAGFAMIARALRTALIEAYESDQVRFARAMGASERDILRRVALRAAAPSVVTVVGLVIATLASGTVLVEHVFQIPGIGQLMVMAFTRPDYDLALGTAIFTALVFLVLNLVVDVAIHVLDPRTHRGSVRGRARDRTPDPAVAP